MSGSIEPPDWLQLPVPQDDGGTAHLAGLTMAGVPLNSTDGSTVDLSRDMGRVVVYAYPRTGRPEVPNPEGWDAIPGARGCTPQSCAFRDHFQELQSLGIAAVFGLSTQSTDYQREVVGRLHLPFPMLSDADLALTKAMRLPTFTTSGWTLLKRFSLIIDGGRIKKVFYPIFPPDQNAAGVVAWLRANQ